MASKLLVGSLDTSMRTCNKCKKLLELESFHKVKSFPLGRAYTCKECARDRSRSWNLENKSRKAETNRKHYLENRESYLDRVKKSTWAKDNKERIRELSKIRYNSNNGASRVAYYRNKRRNATPSWLTFCQKKEMENFYWLAKDLHLVTGEFYDVDHIVPINGKDICGLHVPWNLQILPKDLNISKSNKFGY